VKSVTHYNNKKHPDHTQYLAGTNSILCIYSTKEQTLGTKCTRVDTRIHTCRPIPLVDGSGYAVVVERLATLINAVYYGLTV
jgi:hypothetical protein